MRSTPARPAAQQPAAAPNFTAAAPPTAHADAGYLHLDGLDGRVATGAAGRAAAAVLTTGNGYLGVRGRTAPSPALPHGDGGGSGGASMSGRGLDRLRIAHQRRDLATNPKNPSPNAPSSRET